MEDAFWLVYRVREHSTTPLTHLKPVGGIVARSTLPTNRLYQLADSRYHCGPYEHLLLELASNGRERSLAAFLQNQWRRDLYEFLEMMKNHGPKLDQ